MIRLLIATTSLLGSCAGTTDLAVQLAREVAVLSATVEELGSRLAAVAAVQRADRADKPPLPTASRRREDHAPAADPVAGSRSETPPEPMATSVEAPIDNPAATPVAAPAKPIAEGKPVVDPVRELARTVKELRARMGRERVRSTPLPSTDRNPMPSPKERPTLPPSVRYEGRFQIAGQGKSAWQTVLDTHTGVVHNFRIVDGEPRWVPITRPIGH